MKSKLLALFGVISAVLYGLLQRSKAKYTQRETDISKASEKAGDKATDALIEGLENESTTVKRGHFNK
jgi:hypothetical protein